MHATCVAVDGRGVMICGKSGSGKSTLALELISRGAVLVSDDQVILQNSDQRLIVTAPESVRGKIEARYVGLLKADVLDRTEVHLWVDLDQTETQRLPEQHTITCLGVTLPLLFSVSSPHFAPALLQYLKHGRYA